MAEIALLPADLLDQVNTRVLQAVYLLEAKRTAEAYPVTIEAAAYLNEALQMLRFQLTHVPIGPGLMGCKPEVLHPLVPADHSGTAWPGLG